MRIGIIGYGNLGRGVECAIKQNEDMELVAVFTRRSPESVSILTKGAVVCSVEDIEQWKDKIDVMILCGGSATDLPVQTPKFAEMFNVVDSFDISKTRISTVFISSSFFAVPVPVIVREDTDGRFTSGTVNVKRIPFPAGEGVDSNSSCTHPVSHTVINRTDKR